MKRIVQLSIIILSSIMQSGCIEILKEVQLEIAKANTNTESCWPNKPNIYKQPTQVFDKTATVLPFRDARKKPASPLSSNDVLIGCIPGVLFVSGGYGPPFDPQYHFAQSLTTELQAANAFTEVRFKDTADDSDFIISGTVLDTTRKETMYFYGVSVLAAPLWFILPVGSYSNDLSIEMTCTDAKTGNLVFSQVYTAPEYSKIAWIYYQPRNCNYGEMIKAIYKQFVEELRAKLTERGSYRVRPTQVTISTARQVVD